uniref:Uncharacterized protein n=1 Tax=Anguilla anguilla TaxID=7936 RepID=A0A0E9Q793_ANGAN
MTVSHPALSPQRLKGVLPLHLPVMSTSLCACSYKINNCNGL